MPSLTPRGPTLTKEQIAEANNTIRRTYLTVVDHILAITSLDPETGCWLYLGNPKTTRPRRIIYAAANGPIPPDTHIVRRCHSHRCIFPEHHIATPHYPSSNRPTTGRPIRCIEDGKVYPSLAAAARAYGVQAPNIVKVLRGTRKRISGRTFEYA